MGIPSYFSYIIKNYSNIIRTFSTLFASPNPFQHLYLDCNSIIYDAVRAIEKDHPELMHLEHTDVLESRIIDATIEKIVYYIRLIRPTKTAYIAFDGVAPFAKMDQQRTRRYKGAFLSSIQPQIAMQQDGPTVPTWSTSNITPGTKFMQTLSERTRTYFTSPSAPVLSPTTLIVSASDECGEGEHKLFAHIRSQPIEPDDQAVVYGLDSDLIMLSIFHCRRFRNLYIFRETPEFGELAAKDTSLSGPSYCFMDISKLSSAILMEMQCGATDPHRIYDYVFLCFFLGNDFLPHFPALNIRTHGIDVLMSTYRQWIGKYADRHFIRPSMEIDWKWVSVYIAQLAAKEHDWILAEYDMRKKWAKRTWSVATPNDRDFTFQSAPVIYRAEEDYICPTEKHWEDRYYHALFHGTSDRSDIARNYIEGLEWVFRYYTMDCPDWRWRYRYHYPPLLHDLSKELTRCRTNSPEKLSPFQNIISKPFSPQAQLAYVLPPQNHGLLHPTIQIALQTEEYRNLCSNSIEFQWAFCRYFWEAHVILPEISAEVLDRWSFTLHPVQT